MIKAHLPIEENLVEQLEDALYEITPHNWVLHFSYSKNTSFLEGYFDSSLDAEESLKVLFYTLEIIEIRGPLVHSIGSRFGVKKVILYRRITLGYSLIQVWPLVQGIMRLQNCAWKKLWN